MHIIIYTLLWTFCKRIYEFRRRRHPATDANLLTEHEQYNHIYDVHIWMNMFNLGLLYK